MKTINNLLTNISYVNIRNPFLLFIVEMKLTLSMSTVGSKVIYPAN